MSSVAGTSNPSASGASPEDRFGVIRIPPELLLAAAMRLVSDHSPDPMSAAQRFLDSSRALNIDLSLMWGTVDPSSGLVLGGVRHVCLAVVGAGRTAMLFVSGAARREKAWITSVRRAGSPTGAASADLAERTAIIRRACDELTKGPNGGRPICLAQALLESREKDAAAALRAAGFTQLGELAYLRRPLPLNMIDGQPPVPTASTWPEGIRIESVQEMLARGLTAAQVDQLLIHGLEQSYLETKDCPELCGLRDLSDVLESHRAVGAFDPALWWVIFDPAGAAQGCMLLSVCPEHDSVELVYLGLGPALRERGLGKAVLDFGLTRLYESSIGPHAAAGHPHITGTGGLTCAVDTRNQPAMRLYTRAGFRKFAARVPLIRSLKRSAGETSAEHA